MVSLSAEWIGQLWRFDEDQTLQLPGQSHQSYYLPATPPAQLGHPDFCRSLGLKWPYMAGAMANGIASVELVEALAKEGMLGVFGAAGLPIERIEMAVDRLQRALGHLPFGVNLIHSPSEPLWEERLVDLLLHKGVTLVEASAFMSITKALVRYRVSGIHQDENGEIMAPNQIIAKISRVELAEKFFAPPPDAILETLRDEGHISPEQVQWARRVPLAQYLTAEADSGGHTDNRPVLVLAPLIQAVKTRLQGLYGYKATLHVGVAGGLGTPQAVAAAFSLGASYVVTGTVNQACLEAGTSEAVRDMLAMAEQADVTMAPAADMFEMGIKVQVLKRGTMFPMRAQKLYEIYRSYPSLADIPKDLRENLEKQIFRESLAEVWEGTRAFFAERDPALIQRAEKNPKLQMALVFRSYLGRSSNWANAGELSRKIDFQVWCGPVMGAFNSWCRGSFMEIPHNRQVVTVAWNLMVGASMLTRLHFLRVQGLELADDDIEVLLRPKAVSEIRQLIVGAK